MTYIALLRGINVGGQKSIKMADLAKLFESLGFRNVRTYIQSGNVVFGHASANSANLAGKIEKKIEQTYRFEVKVIIRTPGELKKIIANNPFVHEAEIGRLYVTLLADAPSKQTISNVDIKKAPNEKFTIIGKVIYLFCPNGYGNSKLNNTTFEKQLNMTATTRNWNTMNTLLEMSR